MLAALAYPLLALLIAGPGSDSPAAAQAKCDDPLPIDPAIVTREMKLNSFDGSDQTGPVCYLRWKGGSSPTLMIYGPTPMAELGRTFGSPKEAADQYAGESPKGVEPLPGAKAYMVFDPKTPNRRVFVKHLGKVYMIVSQDQVPAAVLAQAILSR
jgi:hypothetical protein